MEGLGKIWFDWQGGTNLTAIVESMNGSFGSVVVDGSKGRFVSAENSRFSCLLKCVVTQYH
jgi:hypothetical protein